MFEKPIPLEPLKAEKIVLACCVLHNYIRSQRTHVHATPDSDGGVEDGSWRSVPRNALQSVNARATGHNYTAQAARIRDKLCDYVNGVGAVDWQERMVP